ILGELRAFPQRQSPLDRAVIGKKNFLVQDAPPRLLHCQQAQFSTNLSAHIAYCFYSEAGCLIEVIVSSIRGLQPPQGRCPCPANRLNEPSRTRSSAG